MSTLTACLRRAVLLSTLFALPFLAGCEAIWGGLSRDNHENCVVYASCDSSTSFCSPVLERCVPLGKPCGLGLPLCEGVDAVCFDFGNTQRCATNVILNDVVPTMGPSSGGIPLTINGLYFRDGMGVYVGDTLADVIDRPSPQKIVVQLPPGPGHLGPVPIRLVQPDGGFVERSDLFRYFQDPISFEPLSPGIGGANAVATGQMNNDGIGDIVFQVGNQVGVGVGNGLGQFSVSMYSGYAVPSADMVVSDLDGDGNEDVVLAARDPGAANDTLVYVGLGDGTGRLNGNPNTSRISSFNATHAVLADAWPNSACA